MKINLTMEVVFEEEGGESVNIVSASLGQLAPVKARSESNFRLYTTNRYSQQRPERLWQDTCNAIFKYYL